MPATPPWVVAGPEEIAVYAAFPTEGVLPRLHVDLRFVTLEEVAPRWQAVREHLEANPDHASRGLSFVAILRPERFALDGRDLLLPDGSAIGQWWAYVDSVGRSGPPDLTTVLTLGSWIPDSGYADFMRQRGLYAEEGHVSLAMDGESLWWGTIGLEDLVVRAECAPASETRQIPAGGLRLVPPHPEPGSVDLVYVAYDERVCTSWSRTFEGDHPLGSAAVICAPSHLAGFDMQGTLQP